MRWPAVLVRRHRSPRGLIGRQRTGRDSGEVPLPGQDYEVTAHISLEKAYRGTELPLAMTVPEYDARGMPHRTRRTVKARTPKGATDGQRLRLSAQGGRGRNGHRDGNLYLNITLRPHPWFRVGGHD